MKYISLLGVLVLISCNVLFGQERISLGVKAGINLPGIGINSSNPVVDGYKTQLTSYFGIVLETGLNIKWSILSEVDYATISIKKNGSQVIPKSAYDNLNLTTYNFPNYLYANFDSRIQIKYVDVPLMLKYYIFQNEKINFFVNGGVFAGILFRGDVKTQGFGKVYTDAAHTDPLVPFQLSLSQQQDLVGRLQPINWGLQGGAGITLLGKVGDFFANINGNLGIVNIQANSADGANKTKEATIAVGYLFHLSK